MGREMWEGDDFRARGIRIRTRTRLIMRYYRVCKTRYRGSIHMSNR